MHLYGGGLGRMGANIGAAVLKEGPQCVSSTCRRQAGDPTWPKRTPLAPSSLCSPRQKLEKPRAVWLMVPGGRRYTKHSRHRARFWSPMTS